ncbi:MAG: FkbM family methyltransferase [Candidatus Micrarchaeaceae archaeon]|jgi:FkbM family methyltransferase
MIKYGPKWVLERIGYQVVRTQERSPFKAMQYLCLGSQFPVIFDVGAHHGHVSLLFRRLFPQSVVYAFEPFPASFEILKRNTSVDPKIKAFNFGFSDTEGAKPFSINASSATNSLLETDARGKEAWGKDLLETEQRVSLPFTTVDLFLAKMNIKAIDILKLDVQGAEFQILRGARASIAASLCRLVYSEIIIQPTYRGQKDLHEVLQIFNELGFELHNFYDLSCTNNGKLRQLDAIFTSKEAASSATT